MIDKYEMANTKNDQIWLTGFETIQANKPSVSYGAPQTSESIAFVSHRPSTRSTPTKISFWDVVWLVEMLVAQQLAMTRLDCIFLLAFCEAAISSSVANGLNQVVAPAALVDKKHAESKTNNCVQPQALRNIGLLSFA